MGWYNLPNECTVDKLLYGGYMTITDENIRYVAFRYFLEKGYEATNIRDICNEVGIKPSSLYFYYQSKQELFFSIYDAIWLEKIKLLKENEKLELSNSLELNLYRIYNNMVTYLVLEIVKHKFLLRYHLFPPNELSNILRERFKYWTNEENRIIFNIINESLSNNTNLSSEYYLNTFKKFINIQIANMIITNIKVTDFELDLVWSRFWNTEMLYE